MQDNSQSMTIAISVVEHSGHFGAVYEGLRGQIDDFDDDNHLHSPEGFHKVSS